MFPNVHVYSVELINGNNNYGGNVAMESFNEMRRFENKSDNTFFSAHSVVCWGYMYDHLEIFLRLDLKDAPCAR